MKNDIGIKKETILFFPIDSSKEKKTIEIKYTLSGSSFKFQLSVFKEGTPEDFLHFLHEFSRSKNKLGYKTYEKLESDLEQILQGNARKERNMIKGTVSPGSQTIAVFNERIFAYKSFSYALTAYEVYQRKKINLHTKYDQSSPEEVVEKCSYLGLTDKSQLLNFLKQFSRLFSSKLGRYVHKKFTIPTAG